MPSASGAKARRSACGRRLHRFEHPRCDDGGELGVTFVSTIASTPGVRVAGALPPPLLGVERFSAGVLRGSSTRDAAIDFVHALSDAASADQWRAAGFELPAAR